MSAVLDNLSGPHAQVIAAVLALVGVLAGLWAQNRRVHRENRSDHQETADKVARLVSAVGEMAADVRETKADIRDVRDEVRAHGQRLRNLEKMTATQDATDAVVAGNARKLKGARRNAS